MSPAQTLMSPVRSLDWDEPICIDHNLSIRALAGVFERYRVGAVLVSSPAGEPGIVSERDVIRAIAAGSDPDDVVAHEIATSALVTASPHDPIIDVARRMNDHRVRHVAIVDREEIVGLLSMRDLFAMLVDSGPEDGS